MILSVKKDGKDVSVSINNRETAFTDELNDQILSLERIGVLRVTKVEDKNKDPKVKATTFGRGRKKKEEPVTEVELEIEDEEITGIDNVSSIDTVEDDIDKDGGVLSE